jgi:transposase
VDKDGPNARHQHSHQDAEYRRVELITGRKRRRDWTAEEKAEILAATMAPGSTVSEVAPRYGVSPYSFSMNNGKDNCPSTTRLRNRQRAFGPFSFLIGANRLMGKALALGTRQR